ncbi:hypothetical protein LOK49_LG07G03241 [Camellia lanceoleosa]|uniref:Uncharacterized protein n=1 Tax=Camellia lanceoleosa TaxID=1840588 RepID=A0ACC0GY74_9ERIC|nr:hypothetical protein LOK49_LG07G03241 [Camellia lanceoleosa]
MLLTIDENLKPLSRHGWAKLSMLLAVQSTQDHSWFLTHSTPVLPSGDRAELATEKSVCWVHKFPLIFLTLV